VSPSPSKERGRKRKRGLAPLFGTHLCSGFISRAGLIIISLEVPNSNMKGVKYGNSSRRKQIRGFEAKRKRGNRVVL
jgi:hypothetical protein